jgi:hypothetical protein
MNAILLGGISMGIAAILTYFVVSYAKPTGKIDIKAGNAVH